MSPGRGAKGLSRTKTGAEALSVDRWSGNHEPTEPDKNPLALEESVPLPPLSGPPTKAGS